jgi:hypothetical protein
VGGGITPYREGYGDPTDVRDFINDNSIRDKIKTYAPRVGAAAAAGVGTALTSKAMKELSDKALTSKAMKELSDK